MINIIQLSDNMSNSKEDLLRYILTFHYPFEPEYEWANFLVQSQEDLNQWINLWNGDPDEIDQTNRALRKWKVEQRLYDYGEFADLLSLDIQDFIQTYFQQESLDRWVEELERYLDHNSAVELYMLHEQYPSARLENLLN